MARLGPNVSPNGSPVASPSAMATTASPAAVAPNGVPLGPGVSPNGDSGTAPNGVPLGPNVSPNGSQYHLQLLLPPTEWSWVQEYLPTAIVVQLQMARLWDQMSAPMDLLWHLHQQWQPQPALLQLLQMVSHLALESHQMGIVEQLQMVYPWDQTSVQMVPQYHLQLLLPPTEWSWVQEYLPTAIVVQLQMAPQLGPMPPL